MERRNIRLNDHQNFPVNSDSKYNTDSRGSNTPNKPVISSKNEMKRSKSRRSSDLECIDESLIEESPLNQNQINIDTHSQIPISDDRPVEKPFQQHNANRQGKRVVSDSYKTPGSDKWQHQNPQHTRSEFNRKNIENYNYSYVSKDHGGEPMQEELKNKQQMNSHKSHKHLNKTNSRKSTSKEYMRIKKKIEKEMKGPAERLFNSNNYNSGQRRKQFKKSSSKVSPNTSIRHLRSTSPNFKNFTSTNNIMDQYRKKQIKTHKKFTKQSKEILQNSSDKKRMSIKEFSSEKLKPNVALPCANPTRLRSGNRYPLPFAGGSSEVQDPTEMSLKKLNQRAKHKSPNIKGLASGRKLPYEEALEYSSLNHSSNISHISPNHMLMKKYHKNRPDYKNRLNSAKVGGSPNSTAVFERLYKDRTAKAIKMEALREEKVIQEKEELVESARRSSIKSARRSSLKSKSKSKEKRKASKSPEDFYKKQMMLKIDAQKKLAVLMNQKVSNYETEIKNSQRSNSRKKSDL